MIGTMSKKNNQSGKKNPPSRAGYMGTYLPKKLGEELQEIAESQDRSVAYLVRIACQEWLERRKKSQEKQEKQESE